MVIYFWKNNTLLKEEVFCLQLKLKIETAERSEVSTADLGQQLLIILQEKSYCLIVQSNDHHNEIFILLLGLDSCS